MNRLDTGGRRDDTIIAQMRFLFLISFPRLDLLIVMTTSDQTNKSLAYSCGSVTQCYLSKTDKTIKLFAQVKYSIFPTKVLIYAIRMHSTYIADRRRSNYLTITNCVDASNAHTHTINQPACQPTFCPLPTAHCNVCVQALYLNTQMNE